MHRQIHSPPGFADERFELTAITAHSVIAGAPPGQAGGA
jgi:hypothetical protein